MNQHQRYKYESKM